LAVAGILGAAMLVLIAVHSSKHADRLEQEREQPANPKSR
jgi:hypothetical protein